MIGKSEFDQGGDSRTPLQKEYGAGDAEGTFSGLDSKAEALQRLADASGEVK
jgi:hypothetical protein